MAFIIGGYSNLNATVLLRFCLLSW